MNSSEKLKFQTIVTEQIMKDKGYFAVFVEVRRDYTSIVPYENISIECRTANGEWFTKIVHLSCEVIHDTDWHEIAKCIVKHLEDEKVLASVNCK